MIAYNIAAGMMKTSRIINNKEVSMGNMHYIGLDIHKKIIAFCIKTMKGSIIKKGTLPATPTALISWLKTLPEPWMAAMEATLFTGWVYDFLNTPRTVAITSLTTHSRGRRYRQRTSQYGLPAASESVAVPIPCRVCAGRDWPTAVK